MLTKIKRTTWTFSGKATPEAIRNYLRDWQPQKPVVSKRIIEIARVRAHEYGEQLTEDFNELTSGPKLCTLGDIAGGVTGFAQGFITCTYYIAQVLLTDSS